MSDPVQEAVQRVKRVMYPSSQDVGQAVAALDNLIRAVQQEERDKVAAERGEALRLLRLYRWGSPPTGQSRRHIRERYAQQQADTDALISALEADPAAVAAALRKVKP